MLEAPFFDYSLVIATLNDEGDLARCLFSLSSLQAWPTFEVIIVDQNGDDRLAALIAQYSEKFNTVHLSVAFKAANRARNLGSRLARGRWLGFPDDDCEFLPETLVEVERIRVDPKVFVVTGQTIDERGDPNIIRWKKNPMEFNRRTMFGCLTEATMFVNKKNFFAAGGFDERFGPGSLYQAAEGIDLMNRLFVTGEGGKAFYSPRIKIRHPTKIPPWNRHAVRRFYVYAYGDGALIAKNPESHMCYWGLRNLVAALFQILKCKGWRSVAYGARVIGMIKGYFHFRISSWRA